MCTSVKLSFNARCPSDFLCSWLVSCFTVLRWTKHNENFGILKPSFCITTRAIYHCLRFWRLLSALATINGKSESPSNWITTQKIFSRKPSPGSSFPARVLICFWELKTIKTHFRIPDMQVEQFLDTSLHIEPITWIPQKKAWMFTVLSDLVLRVTALLQRP